MGKIPDRLDPAFHKTIRYCCSSVLRNRQNTDINIIYLNELLKFFHRSDRYLPYHFACQIRIRIKQPLDQKTSAFKIHIIGDRLSEMSRTDDDQPVCLIQSEYLTNLRI